MQATLYTAKANGYGSLVMLQLDSYTNIAFDLTVNGYSGEVSYFNWGNNPKEWDAPIAKAIEVIKALNF